MERRSGDDLYEVMAGFRCGTSNAVKSSKGPINQVHTVRASAFY